MARKIPDRGTTKVLVDVVAEAEPGQADDQRPEMVAYLFDANDRLCAQAPVADGQAEVELAADSSARGQMTVVVGPRLEQDEQVTRQALIRRNGVESFIHAEPGDRPLTTSVVVDRTRWRCWLRRCSVGGTLAKRLLSGGEVIEFPVPGATVHVWEVTPIRWIAERLTPVQFSTIHAAMLNPQPLPPEPDPWQLHDAGPQPSWGGLMVAASEPTIAALDLHRGAVSNLRRLPVTASSGQLRSTVLALPDDVLQWLICRHFPWLVTKTEIARARTDHCGHFSANLWLGCRSSANLYFTATIDLWFGLELRIYAPTPVACHTHWNLPCGAQVNLLTTSPFAPLGAPCPPVDAPEGYVLMRALGNVPLSRIRGTSTVLASSTTTDNLGLVADEYGAGLDAPFGGTVRPRLEFDPALRAGGLAVYYRMSYRLGSGAFEPLVGSVDRHYNHKANGTVVTSGYNLGPVVVGPAGSEVINLFEIPPATPPEGTWVYPDPPIDLQNAVFPTAQLPSPIAGGTYGMYQLMIELFDASGAPVELAAAGIEFVVPTTTDPDGTIHTAPASSLGLIDGNRFVMSVRIDNRPVTARLDPVLLDGAGADECGVFRYAPPRAGTVSIPFTAAHPADFALYSFGLTRGTTWLTPPTGGGRVSAATNPATTTRSVAQLLAHPDGQWCDIAGFAENLYVSAMATDGWSRQGQYDQGPQLAAFVLAPQALE